MEQQEPYLLMLEDDDDDRLVTKTYFEANSSSVAIEFLTSCNDVMPFLQRCLTGERPLPRLILLDKNVPAGSGMDVLRQIKSHPVFKVLPVVMISGGALPGEVNESYRIGANSFILKPFSHELTIKRINSFLEYWLQSVELPEVSYFAALAQ